MARRPERNPEAYNESGLLNLGLTSLDIIINDIMMMFNWLFKGHFATILYQLRYLCEVMFL